MTEAAEPDRDAVSLCALRVWRYTVRALCTRAGFGRVTCRALDDPANLYDEVRVRADNEEGP